MQYCCRRHFVEVAPLVALELLLAEQSPQANPAFALLVAFLLVLQQMPGPVAGQLAPFALAVPLLQLALFAVEFEPALELEFFVALDIQLQFLPALELDILPALLLALAELALQPGPEPEPSLAPAFVVTDIAPLGIALAPMRPEPPAVPLPLPELQLNDYPALAPLGTLLLLGHN